MRRIALAALTVAAILSTGACGAAFGGGADPDSKLTPVTLAVLPDVEVAPIYLGKAQGIFARNGLDLKLVQASSDMVVPGVLSGEYDYAYSNDMSVIVARSQGLPMKIVAGAASSTGVRGGDFAGLVVANGGAVASVRDLKNKTVGVDSLKGLSETAVRASMRKAGGDDASIKFLEVSPNDVPAALAAGRIDAGWVSEPYLSVALAQGDRLLSNPYLDLDGQLSSGVYFADEDWVAANGALAQRVTKALNESVAYAQSHPDQVRQTLPAYLKISSDLAERIVLPQYSSDVTLSSLQVLAHAAEHDGLIVSSLDIGTSFDVSELIR